MARANRHYLPDRVWHLTHRCHQRSFLLKLPICARVNMNRVCAFILLSTIIFYGCGSVAVERNGSSPLSVPLKNPEAYAIYNEALKHYAARQDAHTVSIVRYTKLDDPPPKCLEAVYDSMPWRSAIADLRRKNSSAHAIERRFDVPFTYELADEMEQIGGARATPPGMTRSDFLLQEMGKLQQRSRAHFTQVQLSVPGVSDDGRVAVVYIEISFAGEFWILHKNGDMWNVEPRSVCAWVS